MGKRELSMIIYIFTTLLLCATAFLWNKIAILNRTIKTQKAELVQKDSEIKQNIVDNTRLTSELKHVSNLLGEYKSTMTETLKAHLVTLSQENLQKQSEQFLDSSTKNIKHILQPLQQEILTIKETQKNIDKSHIRINDLLQPLPATIDKLTKSLKGDFKARGDFGEMLLEKLLQYCGFKEDIHYKLQFSFKDSKGNIARPDCMFLLPNENSMVIDVKTPLKHSFDFFASTDPKQQKELLAQHVKAIRDHIKDLATKNYQSLEGVFDFVLMFLPHDHSLFSAYENDTQLQSFAFANKIILVSPTLFVPFLQLIRNFIRLAEADKNATKIADIGGKICDKIAGIAEDMQKITNTLSTLTNHKNALERKIHGNGGLIPKAEAMKNLGAKTTKPFSIKTL